MFTSLGGLDVEQRTPGERNIRDKCVFFFCYYLILREQIK